MICIKILGVGQVRNLAWSGFVTEMSHKAWLSRQKYVLCNLTALAYNSAFRLTGAGGPRRSPRVSPHGAWLASVSRWAVRFAKCLAALACVLG